MEIREHSRRLLTEARDWQLLALVFSCPNPVRDAQIQELIDELETGDLRSAAEAAVRTRQEDYLAVLGPSAVSSREVGYRPMGDPGKILAQLATLYDAFGFHPPANEPLDHVATELGFASFLCFKEAFARQNGEDQQAVSCTRARELLVADHLADLGAGLAERLSGAPVPSLEQAARLLAERLPVPKPSTSLPILAEEPADSAFDCGEPPRG